MEPWAWAIIVPVALALIGAIWAMFRQVTDRLEKRLDDHILDDVKVHEQAAVKSAVNAADIQRLKEDIGDHNSGIRGWLHSLSNDVSPWLIRRQERRMKRDRERKQP